MDWLRYALLLISQVKIPITGAADQPFHLAMLSLLCLMPREKLPLVIYCLCRAVVFFFVSVFVNYFLSSQLTHSNPLLLLFNYYYSSERRK